MLLQFFFINFATFFYLFGLRVNFFCGAATKQRKATQRVPFFPPSPGFFSKFSRIRSAKNNFQPIQAHFDKKNVSRCNKKVLSKLLFFSPNFFEQKTNLFCYSCCHCVSAIISSSLPQMRINFNFLSLLGHFFAPSDLGVMEWSCCSNILLIVN